jgi:exonuclease SbcC
MLKSLSLKNFKTYDSTSIDFKGGVTAIIGENGIGKSTILQAIEYALYGKVKTHGRFFGTKFTPDIGTALIQTNKKSASVRLRFTSPVTKKDYTVIRRITHKGATAELLEDGRTLTRGITAVNRTIESLIGADIDSFSAIAYVRQGEISSLTLAPPREREGVINSILNLEIYGEAAKKANEQKRELEAKVNRLEVQLGQIKELHEDCKKMLAQLNEELRKTKPKLRELTTKEKQLKKEQRIAQKIRELDIQIEGKKKHIQTLREGSEEKIKGAQTEIKLAEEKEKFRTPPFVVYGIILTLILFGIFLMFIPILGILILVAALGAIAFMYRRAKAKYKPRIEKIESLRQALEKTREEENLKIQSEEKTLAKFIRKRASLVEKITVENIDAEVSQTEQEKEDILGRVKELQGKIKTTEGNMKQYKADIKRLEKERKEYNKKIEDLSVVIDGILKAMPRWIRLRLIALVRAETKNIFMKMFGGKYKDLRITNDYNIEVLSPYGSYFPVSMISGGEDTAANVALRLGISRAMQKVYSEVREATGSLGLLIMDEPTTHLDRKRREILTDVVKAVKDLPQVIVATNVEEVESAAKNKIFLSKESPMAPTITRCIYS